MKTRTILFAYLLFPFLSTSGQNSLSDSIVTDIDGNVYHTVTIAGQVWLKENLKVTHYRNGDAIPMVPGATAWAGLTSGAYCNYNNVAGNAATYGRLYNWYATQEVRGIAPEGWHVATDQEWSALTDYLGGEAVAGGKLKETGTLHWGPPNVGATDEVGFTALPGGYRANNEVFIGLSSIGSWWTSDASDPGFAWARGIFNEAVNVDRGGYYEQKMGFSIRCVRDINTGINPGTGAGKINFRPNPASDRITVDLPPGQTAGMLTLYDLAGRIVLRQEINQAMTSVNISSLKGGTYLIEISALHDSFRKILIKK
jgi:uncharacterized protein (TIGR02145 family)